VAAILDSDQHMLEDPPKEHSNQVWFQLIQWFQRKFISKYFHKND
jgi:hypothetical protein